MDFLMTFMTFLATVFIGLALILIAARLLQPKMDKRVKALADLAWTFSAAQLGVKPKGKTPAVKLRSKPDGNTIGNYKRFRIPLINHMVYERIWVVDDVSYIWSNLAHEMAHAHRARAGKKVTEREAEDVEASAREARSNYEVAALLDRFSA